MEETLLHSKCNLKVIFVGPVFGFIVPAAFVDPALAEKMDLGQIPKTQVEGWCKAHSGQYLDWGGAGSTCMTDAGGAMYCDKNDNCTGIPLNPRRALAGGKARAHSRNWELGGKLRRSCLEASNLNRTADRRTTQRQKLEEWNACDSQTMPVAYVPARSIATS